MKRDIKKLIDNNGKIRFDISYLTKDEALDVLDYYCNAEGTRDTEIELHLDEYYSFSGNPIARRGNKLTLLVRRIVEMEALHLSRKYWVDTDKYNTTNCWVNTVMGTIDDLNSKMFGGKWGEGIYNLNNIRIKILEKVYYRTPIDEVVDRLFDTDISYPADLFMGLSKNKMKDIKKIIIDEAEEFISNMKDIDTDKLLIEVTDTVDNTFDSISSEGDLFRTVKTVYNYSEYRKELISSILSLSVRNLDIVPEDFNTRNYLYSLHDNMLCRLIDIKSNAR